MRVNVLIVGADLRQVMDFGVAYCGGAYAATLAHCEDVIERARLGMGRERAPTVVCLSGAENADHLADFLALDPIAVFVAPPKIPNAIAEVLQDEVVFTPDTAPLVVQAALIVVARERALGPRPRNDEAASGHASGRWQDNGQN